MLPPETGLGSGPSLNGWDIMSESLVIIRTFGEYMDADEAQVELLSAGIYSLLFTDDSASAPPSSPAPQGIALAVHSRDADIAEAVLVARPMPR